MKEIGLTCCDPLVWIITALFGKLKGKKNLHQNHINKIFLKAGRIKDLSKDFQKETEI